MANTIELQSKYAELLLEVGESVSKTTVLDSDATGYRPGMNANEIGIPRISTDGLADYNRTGNCTNGYVGGNITLAYDSVKFNYDRGRMFCVDSQDNAENGNIFSSGMLMSTFVRDYVIPESDAFKFASYYSSADSKDKVTETLDTPEKVIASITKGSIQLDNLGVNSENRYLFINPTIAGMLMNLDTYKSKAFLSKFTQVIEVPEPRFYSGIELYDGTTSGEEKGGYAKASGALDVNYMIIPKSSVIQYTKHIVNRVIDPTIAQYSSDAWKFMYRVYGLYKLIPNRHIYASAAPAV